MENLAAYIFFFINLERVGELHGEAFRNGCPPLFAYTSLINRRYGKCAGLSQITLPFYNSQLLFRLKTLKVRRKRHEFMRAVSKGLIPPETPPALRRVGLASIPFIIAILC